MTCTFVNGFSCGVGWYAKCSPQRVTSSGCEIKSGSGLGMRLGESPVFCCSVCVCEHILKKKKWGHTTIDSCDKEQKIGGLGMRLLYSYISYHKQNENEIIIIVQGGCDYHGYYITLRLQ